jgi:hypothetical protein
MKPNPAVLRLIQEGVLRVAPLRPRSTADIPRIRAAFKNAA